MYTSLLLTIGALATGISAQFFPPQQGALYGGQCQVDGLQHCINQGAWGCVQLQGPNCVDQTQVCDAACGFTGFAYQKDRSPDRTCVCSFQDASQPLQGWFKRAESFQA